MTRGRPTAENWPQISDILVNHAGGRPDPTPALTGHSVTIGLEDGASLALTFVTGSEVVWTLSGRTVQAQPYEAFAVRRDAYFVDFIDRENDRRSLSIWLDLGLGCALLVEGSVEDKRLAKADLLTRVRNSGSQSVAQVRIRAGSLRQGRTSTFRRSTKILGRFVRYKYSDTHVYDHYYVSKNYYHWYCWSGPDAGLGELDEVDCYDLGEELFLVCWREKLLPCLAVTIEDYREMRTIGKIFGADAVTWATGNTTVGADMTVLTQIPPARAGEL